MASAGYDLIYLQEAIADLEGYLLSDDVYWNFRAQPPPGEPMYPALSLGGILFAKKRLEGRVMPSKENAQYLSITNQLDTISTRWHFAWEKKAAAGFKARLTQWRNFLDEYRHNPSSNFDRYPYEVRLRVMLDLLDEANPNIPDAQHKLLESLDALLKAKFMPGPFVWDQEYQNSFPIRQFGYLYGSLTSDGGEPE